MVVGLTVRLRTASSSVIVPVAVASASSTSWASVVPVLDRVNWKVSVGSVTASFCRGTAMVLLVSPAAKVTVPVPTV